MVQFYSAPVAQHASAIDAYGLLSGAFRPEAEIRRLRGYLRQRAMPVQYASHRIQHMRKALVQMNVKLQHVISNITGQTGLAIIEAIIARSLQGHWRKEHIFELTQDLELYRVYQAKIHECDRELKACLEQFEDRSDGGPFPATSRRRSQGNAPSFDIRDHLYRMTGVGLTTIDGIDGFTALKVVSEIGLDMTKWANAKYFAPWLGLSPNNRITGGRVISSKTKPSANREAEALRLAAHGLHRSDSALGRLPAPEEGTTGSSQGHHSHCPQAGQDHLLHVAIWPGLRGCRRRILRGPVSSARIASRQTPGSATGL